MLLVVLGIRIVEVLAAENLTIAGLRAWRPAKVTPKLMHIDVYMTVFAIMRIL